ncbi:hypothetical protein T10_11801 [Trichinella papuae]|uniref:Uncharacterized protein n=1 Tax=Trichinella papuae TaxID=268474 RepID=A0A0V1MT94_9BILA|nr:hypothetical protein T10_11801 [Trichinella papuae]
MSLLQVYKKAVYYRFSMSQWAVSLVKLQLVASLAFVMMKNENSCLYSEIIATLKYCIALQQE